MTIAKISLHGILNSHLNEKTILVFCYKVVVENHPQNLPT